MRNYLSTLIPRLPGDVYVLQAGGLLNAFGNGIVLPFLIIYLHNVRGISLALAGLAAATQSATALASGLAAGTLSDRVGPKRVLIAALVVMTIAFALMALIREPWHAFAVYIIWGAGSGAFWPAQSALLAGLTPPESRSPAYALQRLTMNLGAAIGGLTAGFIASVAHPGSFTILFLVNCTTYLAYIVVLLRVRSPELHPERTSGSWRAVARDRTFVAYTALNAAFMTAAISLMIELLPAFGKNVTHVSEQEVGVIYAINAIGIVILQLPIARFVAGRRRMLGLAAMGVVWAIADVVVWAAGAWAQATVAAALLAFAMLVFASGECLHGAIHAPLGVDLAPPQLVGRYLALSSLSWQVGWIIGPAAGGFALAEKPLLLWPVAAAINLACAGWAIALEPRIPERARITPLGPVTAGSPG
jgi:MFS family permease